MIYHKGKAINAPTTVWLGSAWEWDKTGPVVTLATGTARDRQVLALAVGGSLLVPYHRGCGRANQLARLNTRMLHLCKGRDFTVTTTASEDGLVIRRTN